MSGSSEPTQENDFTFESDLLVSRAKCAYVFSFCGAVWFGVSFIDVIVSLTPKPDFCCLVLREIDTWPLRTQAMLFLAAATGLCTYATVRCKKRYDALQDQYGPCGTLDT